MLERLAARYRENWGLSQMNLMVWTHDKASLAVTLKGFGGKWKKNPPKNDDDYALQLLSVDLHPLAVFIPRNKVCRKIVRFECEPLLSPEDEAELEAVI